MDSRYGALTVYAWTLAVIAGGWLFHDLAQVAAFPPLWVTALCCASCLFVFQFGLRAPRIGLISMERVPQVALLLTVDTAVAAAICATASLLWPLLNRRYSQGSWRVGLLRGVHNAGMTALMLMIAGKVYVALGGHHPLHALAAGDTVPLVALAVTEQVVNLGLMMLFFRFDGRDVRKIFTYSYALADLIFVPAGLLAALLFNAAAPATFALYVCLLVLFILIFNGIGQNPGGVDFERSPFAKLFHTRRALHGVRSVESLGQRVVAEAHTLFRFDEFYLALANREKGLLELRVHERLGKRMPARTKPLRAGLFGHVIESGRTLLVMDWSRAPEALRQRAEVTEKQTGSVMMVPLVERGTTIGLLSMQHTTPGVYSAADIHLLERLAEEVAVAVADARAFEDAEEYRQRLEQRVTERTEELEKANREKENLLTVLRERSLTLERESLEDPLTGIANRRHFLQRLSNELELARAGGHPLTLAIADMDYFKVINDRFGHHVGDEALRQSAALLRDLCRPSDVVARIGGEEFALLLPGTDLEAAFRLCEAARLAVESHHWQSVHGDLRATISVGVGQWDGRSTAAELLHAADSQLYAAKRAGRNRVAMQRE
jgi:diguanylate cyclase (GGDEF)-like protein